MARKPAEWMERIATTRLPRADRHYLTAEEISIEYGTKSTNFRAYLYTKKVRVKRKQIQLEEASAIAYSLKDLIVHFREHCRR